MKVREHHCINIAGIYLQFLHVAQQTVARSGIEKQVLLAADYVCAKTPTCLQAVLARAFVINNRNLYPAVGAIHQFVPKSQFLGTSAAIIGCKDEFANQAPFGDRRYNYAASALTAPV
jgi:hypothetical protein